MDAAEDTEGLVDKETTLEVNIPKQTIYQHNIPKLLAESSAVISAASTTI